MSSAAAFVDAQRAAGAEFEEANGLFYAASYGDPEGELCAARDGAVLVWQPWRAYLRVTGDERLTFLHRLLTANVQILRPGDGTAALLLDNRGKIQASLDLWVGDAAVLLGSAATVIASVAEGLRRYVLRSAVHIDTDPMVSFALIGPRHETVAAALGVEPPAAAGQSACGSGLRSLRTRRLPGGFEIALSQPAASELWHAVCQLTNESVRLAGRDVSEVLRVEAGVPSHGAELTGNELPQEARLDDAVDFEKGCYLGQETVARIHYRGHVNRLLCGLRLSAGVAPGATLSGGGRAAGNVTSTAVSDRHGPIGLGYLRRELAGPGGEVQVDDGSTANVVALPFDGGARLGAATQSG